MACAEATFVEHSDRNFLLSWATVWGAGKEDADRIGWKLSSSDVYMRASRIVRHRLHALMASRISDPYDFDLAPLDTQSAESARTKLAARGADENTRSEQTGRLTYFRSSGPATPLCPPTPSAVDAKSEVSDPDWDAMVVDGVGAVSADTIPSPTESVALSPINFYSVFGAAWVFFEMEVVIELGPRPTCIRRCGRCGCTFYAEHRPQMRCPRCGNLVSQPPVPDPDRPERDQPLVCERLMPHRPFGLVINDDTVENVVDAPDWAHSVNRNIDNSMLEVAAARCAECHELMWRRSKRCRFCETWVCCYYCQDLHEGHCRWQPIASKGAARASVPRWPDTIGPPRELMEENLARLIKYEP